MTGLRAAWRTVLRGPLWLTAVFLASFMLALALMPARLFTVPAPLAQNPVDAAYAQHHCAPTPTGGPLLLITTAMRGPELVLAARTVDGQAEQADWLADERAGFYGWCS